MRNEKLRGVFEQLGFGYVSSLLTSGNILFSTGDGAGAAELESRIQSALQQQLGIDGGVIVRSRDQLQALAEQDPFNGLEHSKATYLTVTLFKEAPAEPPLTCPEVPEVSITTFNDDAQALLAVVDSTENRMTDYMAWLQRRFGVHVTTRTWNTVLKILKRMENQQTAT